MPVVENYLSGCSRKEFPQRFVHTPLARDYRTQVKNKAGIKTLSSHDCLLFRDVIRTSVRLKCRFFGHAPRILDLKLL